MEGYIYIIKNKINEKVYIGQTINSINQRLSEHFSKSKNDSIMYLSRAIRKHGKENFYIEELEKCPVEKLNERERWYIQKYNSIENGYNTAMVFDSYYIKRIDLNIGKARYLYEIERKTLDYIAKEIGTSRFILRNELEKIGVVIRPNGQLKLVSEKIDIDKVKEYLNNNISLRKIAKLMNVSYSTIRDYCIEYNLSKSAQQSE